MTNKNLLFSKIIENGLNCEKCANALGISNRAFSCKANNKNEFKASEIQELISLLNISVGEIVPIFFSKKVD